MRFTTGPVTALLTAALAFSGYAQQASLSLLPDASAIGEQPGAKPASDDQQSSEGQSSGKPNTSQSESHVNTGTPWNQQQPKRILGFMPNFRAVSAGALPPPPTEPLLPNMLGRSGGTH